MPDHDADVATVLEAVVDALHVRFCEWSRGDDECPCDRHGRIVLAALTAENYAVVRLPEGVAVEHGARLVGTGYAACVFRVELSKATP